MHGGIIAAFCAWLPYLNLQRLVKRGRVDDVHIVRRSQRLAPLLVTISSVVVGIVLAWALNTPREVLVLVVVMLASLCVMAAITTVHKVSFHAGVATGAAGVLNAPGSPWWVTAFLVATVAAVCWARVRAGRHAPGQVALGVVVGAVATWVFWVLA